MKYKIMVLCMLIPCFLWGQNFSDGHFDAALDGGNRKVYFFKGKYVIAFDNKKMAIEPGYPVQIADEFPGVTFSSIDAALDWGNGKVYFFKGTKYIRFDKQQNRADSGYPKPINNSTWPGLGFSSIDSALNWGNGKAYFMKGREYVRYDIQTDRADSGYPAPLNSSNWDALAFRTIDAAYRDNNRAFVFNEANFQVYDTIADRIVKEYPREIAAFYDIKEQKEDRRDNDNRDDRDDRDDKRDEKGGDFSNVEVTRFTIDTSPYSIRSPNSVLHPVYVKSFPDGEVVAAFQQKHDLILIRLDRNFERIGSPVVLKKYWYSDMLPMEDGSLMVLAGKDVNNYYIEDYPNTLYLFKLNSRGKQVYKTHIFGGEGHEGGQSWFDGRSKARIAYNGSTFGVYFEVQKNWAERGQAEDIHNGDMFVVVSKKGKIDDSKTHFWTASHSSTIGITHNSRGEYVTMTIGDAYPYGLQVYNRDRNKDVVVWPPKEDYIPYEKVNSTNAAGILTYTGTNGSDYVAFMGTLDHPNIGWNTKVDPLFLRITPEGAIKEKVWLEQNAGRDSSTISVVPVGSGYLVGWSAGNVYENDWKADTFTVALIDGQGSFIMKPREITHPFGTYSDLCKISKDTFIWVDTEYSGESFNLYRMKLK